MYVTTSEREVVAALQQAIAERIGEPRYQLWFPDKTKFTWHDEQLTVGVPNHFYQEWLKKQFADVVRAAAEDVIGQAVDVKFAIDPELFQAARREEAARPPLAPAPEPQSFGRPTEQGSNAVGAEKPAVPLRSPQRSRRWHQFARIRRRSLQPRGPCRGPERRRGTGPRPQPAGAARTSRHRARVICWKASTPDCGKPSPEWRVVFTTAEEFTNRFLPAMRFGKLAQFP